MLGFIGCARESLFVTQQFDPHQQAKPARITDERMAFCHLPHVLECAVAERARMFDERFFFDDLQRGQPRGAGDGIFLVRVMTERLAGGDVQPFAREQSGEGKNSAAQSFAEH